MAFAQSLRGVVKTGSITGGAYDAVKDNAEAMVKATGVPDIRFHDLRHSSASLAAVAGVEPKVLSERLGHAPVDFTMSVYAHSYAKQHNAAADMMGALLKPRVKTP